MTQTGDSPRDDESIVELDLTEVGAFLDKVRPPGDVEGEAAQEDDAVEPATSPEPAEPSPEGSDPEGQDPEEADADDDASSDVLPASGDSSIDGDRPRIKLRIPGYEIVGVVGRGATGIVYRARQEAVDRKVALKVLHPELITNRRAVRRLQREARLAARLAHPSIISAIDMGKVDGQWWYAMELVEGVSLSRRIAERGTLTEREVLRLFSPLCDALQHAHECGVVHRDIKPANILIDRRGRARLVDLGLAIGQNDPSITRTGSTLGTPHYVSPEQARDPRQADVRSDIWSVGATMYHAACGRPPFHAEAEEDGGVAEILSRVLYEPVVDPREYVPALSKGFALMLRKCLTRDPQQRYQEPWELVADIELLRERRRLDLRGSNLDQFASRRPAWVGSVLAGGVVVLAIAGTWAITARPWEDRPGPVVTPRAATLGDWPELHAIDQGFRAGRIAHAEALAGLDASALQGIPDSAHQLGSGLVVQIKADLGRTVDGCLESAGGDVDRQLFAHEFDDAAATVASGLDERLRQSTGFERAEDLPPGGRLRDALRWKREQAVRVSDAHDAARLEAGKTLHSAYPRLVRDRVEALLAENRWRDAMELLDPKNPHAWLELDGLQLDLRGLDGADRNEIMHAIDAYVSSDTSHVRNLTLDAVKDARGFLQAELDRLISEINSDQVTGPDTAAARLDRSIEAKHASLGLDIEQLTSLHRESYRSEVADALASLESHEGRRRDQLAQSGLDDLEVLLRPMLYERRYGDARQIYRSAREEAWRSSTFEILDARMRELDLLDEVLGSAVASIVARDGKTIELHFGRIPARGRIDANGPDTARLGFRLISTRASAGPRHVMFRRSSENRRGVDVLEVDDVLELAGLGDEAGLDPRQQLSAAAFLAAEGRPEEARARIRLEDHPASDPLPADLEARVRPLVEAHRRDTEREAQSSRSTPEPVTAPPTFEETFGVPNQAKLLRKVHLVWRFSDDSDVGGQLRRPLPDDESRKGAWTARGWTLRPTGYTLDAELAEHADFLALDVGPTLALGEPLRDDRRITVRVEITPDEGRPDDGHLIALSVRGYHVLIVDHRFKPQVWFGTGEFRALYDHVVHGEEVDLRAFHVRKLGRIADGERTSIEVELREGALDKLLIGGVEINMPTFVQKPSRPDPYVRLRSRKPMTLHAAEVFGEQH